MKLHRSLSMYNISTKEHDITKNKSHLTDMIQSIKKSEHEPKYKPKMDAANFKPICIKVNKNWANKETRPGSKYSPVVVAKNQDEQVVKSMGVVKDVRVDACQNLASKGKGSSNWVSFKGRPNENDNLKLNEDTIPAIVISGGSAKKLASEMARDYKLSLAFHPNNMQESPVYILVHEADYIPYNEAFSELKNQYKNLHIIGWDAGKLTGFGAARSAAVAFADALTYKPKRFMMMDQDLLKTQDTRHTNPRVNSEIQRKHNAGMPVVGYGVPFPNREGFTGIFANTAKPEHENYNAPTAAFVDINAPYRKPNSDGAYPAWMVSGGEDMYMTKHYKFMKDDVNTSLLDGRIVKKELQGESDFPNKYWNENRVETLKLLFEAEKDTLLRFDNKDITLDELMHEFVKSGYIESHPSPESYFTASSVIERIILRLQMEGNDESGLIGILNKHNLTQ